MIKRRGELFKSRVRGERVLLLDRRGLNRNAASRSTAARPQRDLIFMQRVGGCVTRNEPKIWRKFINLHAHLAES